MLLLCVPARALLHCLRRAAAMRPPRLAGRLARVLSPPTLLLLTLRLTAPLPPLAVRMLPHAAQNRLLPLFPAPAPYCAAQCSPAACALRGSTAQRECATESEAPASFEMAPHGTPQGSICTRTAEVCGGSRWLEQDALSSEEVSIEGRQHPMPSPRPLPAHRTAASRRTAGTCGAEHVQRLPGCTIDRRSALPREGAGRHGRAGDCRARAAREKRRQGGNTEAATLAGRLRHAGIHSHRRAECTARGTPQNRRSNAIRPPFLKLRSAMPPSTLAKLLRLQNGRGRRKTCTCRRAQRARRPAPPPRRAAPIDHSRVGF